MEINMAFLTIDETKCKQDGICAAECPRLIITQVDGKSFPQVAEVDEAVVGAGLLLQTDRIAGMHMVGVPPEHRRKGYARQIMFGLLTLARELGCECATLQASTAGEPLYRWLGFKAQGPIRSFRKSQP